MNAMLQALVQSYIEAAEEAAQPKHKKAVKAQGAMLLNAMRLTVKPTKPPKDPAGPKGPPLRTFTIQIDYEGCYHASGINEVAALVGRSPSTVSVRLSTGAGTYRFTRTHPETGNPVACAVVRGAVGVHSDKVAAWLQRTDPKQRGKAQPSRPAPAPDASGYVNKLRGRRPGFAIVDDYD